MLRSPTPVRTQRWSGDDDDEASMEEVLNQGVRAALHAALHASRPSPKDLTPNLPTKIILLRFADSLFPGNSLWT